MRDSLNAHKSELFYGNKVELNGKVYFANTVTKEVFCQDEDDIISGSILGVKCADITDDWALVPVEGFAL